MTTVRKWIGPALTALLVMALYQWFIHPMVEDIRQDLLFLHQARMQVIQQQMQQRAAQAQKP